MNIKTHITMLATLLLCCADNKNNPDDNGALPDMQGSAIDMSKPPPVGKPWTLGLIASDGAQGNRVAAGKDGSALAVGSFRGSLTLGGNTYTTGGGTATHAFFVKYGADGEYLVSGQIGDSSGAEGLGIADDSAGNIYVASTFTGSVHKYGSDGTPIWTKGLLADGTAIHLAVGINHIILVGQFINTIDLGGGSLISAGKNDMFIAKFSLDGVHQWSKRFGGIGDDFPSYVALDSKGSIIVTGYFNDAIDFGAEHWTSKGKEDLFVVKLSLLGAVLWGEQIGSSQDDQGSTLALDRSDNIILTAQLGGSADVGGKTLSNSAMVVQKLSPAGGSLWVRGSTSGAAYPFGGAVDETGQIVVVGLYSGPTDIGGGPLAGPGGTFAATYNADGGFHGAQTFNGSSFNFGQSVASVARGAIVLMGLFEGTIDVNGMHFASLRRNTFLTRMALP